MALVVFNSMDNSLRLFENPDFGDVRVLLDESNEPWFVGNDVARCLGYENLNNTVKRFVDEEDCILLSSDCESRGFKTNPLINQAVREVRLINESGIYSLIMSSKLESAKKFKRWVTSEVLPSIRKTGSYSMPSNIPMTYADALRKYADEVEAREKAEKEARLALEAKKISDDIIKAQAPKVEFANTAIMANDKEDMLIRDVRRELETHGYDIAERSLREYLQDQNFFYKNKREWILTASAIDRGYGHYRYNADVLKNTVYMTRKGFERLLYNLRYNPRSRESFLSFGGKILND